MLDKYTTKNTIIVLIIARIVTGIISMPTVTPGMTTYTQIDSIFRLISTLIMILIIVIALNALGNYSKHKHDQE